MAPLTPPDQPELTAGGINTVTPTAGQKKPRIAWVNQLGISTCIAYPCRGEYTHLGLPFRGSLSRPRSGNQGAIYSHHERIALITDRSGSRQIWVARAFRARFAAGRPGISLLEIRRSRQPCSYSTRRVNWGLPFVCITPAGRIATCRNGAKRCGDWVRSLHQALP
jgi:hypothetical protein